MNAVKYGTVQTDRLIEVHGVAKTIGAPLVAHTTEHIQIAGGGARNILVVVRHRHLRAQGTGYRQGTKAPRANNGGTVMCGDHHGCSVD